MADITNSQDCQEKAVLGDEVNCVRTEQSVGSNHTLELEMSACSFPSQQNGTISDLSPSSAKIGTHWNESIVEEKKPNRTNSLSLGPSTCSTSPLPLSSVCEVPTGSVNSAKKDRHEAVTVAKTEKPLKNKHSLHSEPSPLSTSSCPSQQCSDDTILPLSSACKVSTRMITTTTHQHLERQVKEMEKPIDLELSTRSCQSQKHSGTSTSSLSAREELTSRGGAGCSEIHTSSEDITDRTGSLQVVPSSTSLTCEDSEQASSANTTSSDGGLNGDKFYDFMVLFHEEDRDAADRIYNILEEEHHLHGFMNGRDDIPGTYQHDEMHKAIEKSNKILLLLTHKSITDERFVNFMQASLYHSIHEKHNNKLIPILSGINQDQIPKIIKHKFNIDYQDCSSRFKFQLLKIFRLRSSVDFFNKGQRSSSLVSSNGKVCDKLSDAPQLRQSQSLPTTTTKKSSLISRLFSSPK